MSNKHDLKQIQQWARDWGLGKWMNADAVDEDSPRHRKFNKGPRPNNNGKRPYNNNKKRPYNNKKP